MKFFLDCKSVIILVIKQEYPFSLINNYKYDKKYRILNLRIIKIIVFLKKLGFRPHPGLIFFVSTLSRDKRDVAKLYFKRISTK